MVKLMVLAGTCLTIAAAMACGGSERPESPSEFNEGGDLSVPSFEIEQARRDSDLVSLKLLSDGFLSFAEYESVTLEYVACVESAGASLGRPLVAGKLRVYAIEFVSPATSAAAVREAVPRCGAPTYDRISRLWSLGNAPSEEVVREARTALANCLRTRGLSVPDDPGPEYFANAGRSSAGTTAMLECSAIVSEEYGIPYFGG